MSNPLHESNHNGIPSTTRPFPLPDLPFHEYPTGITLIRQGVQVSSVYVIERGIVKLSIAVETGKEIITGIRGPGWILGSAAAFLGKESPVTAATVLECRLGRIKSNEFLHRVRTDPALSNYLHIIHCEEIYWNKATALGLAAHSAKQRMEHLVWTLARGVRPSIEVDPTREFRFRMPLKQWEIAQAVAISESWLSKLLREIEVEGTFRREKEWYVIPNPMNLRRRVESLHE